MKNFAGLVKRHLARFFAVIACLSFSELENDTLNQAELNEIKINENN
jgi:hypothetical protein